MKRLAILLLSLLLISFPASAQTPNYSEDIAPILFSNCSYCHHTGGIAPFPLMSYQDAVNKSGLIGFMVSSGKMPPWPPDTTYQRYVHERVLTQDQIQKITDWVSGGTPQGYFLGSCMFQHTFVDVSKFQAFDTTGQNSPRPASSTAPCPACGAGWRVDVLAPLPVWNSVVQGYSGAGYSTNLQLPSDPRVPPLIERP